MDNELGHLWKACRRHSILFSFYCHSESSESTHSKHTTKVFTRSSRQEYRPTSGSVWVFLDSDLDYLVIGFSLWSSYSYPIVRVFSNSLYFEFCFCNLFWFNQIDRFYFFCCSICLFWFLLFLCGKPKENKLKTKTD